MDDKNDKSGKSSLSSSNQTQQQLKWMSLIYFVLQNVFLAIGIRVCHEFSDPFHPYISSTAVLCTETTKLFLSIVICFVHDAEADIWKFRDITMKAFLDEGADLLKLLVPALLYCIQNNLQYVIESAPLFLVMYQLKVITTAIFYSSLLQRRINNKEWLTIIILAIGVGMVQSSQKEFLPHHASNVIGMFSVAFACVTSGMAGVFFEKTIKQSKSTIWMINVQMSLLSCVLSMIITMVSSTDIIIDLGFFSGFNPYVISVVFLQAITGLVIAMVVKYSDNIHKGFATSISIVLSGFLESLLFKNSFDINLSFAIGSVLVGASSVLFIHITNQRHWSSSATGEIVQQQPTSA